MSVSEPPAESVGAEPVHRSYIPDAQSPPELTWSAVLLGAILGIVFGASSLYLSLKVGLTVSASIPVAVLSIALFRAFGRGKGRILENNIAQTTGSAGESIAFGVGVTMPALMILGYDLELTRVMLVASLGGLLGILMMIPLRRAFIVKQHGSLPYPEGTACAKVLIAGEAGGSSARTVLVGLGVGFFYQLAMQGLKLWKDTPARAFSGFKGAILANEASPALLGVGYIIGYRISAVMVAGGLLSAMVLTPAFALSDPTPIREASILEDSETLFGKIRNEHVLYIGAGAVATGGLISLCQSLPLILGSIAGGLRDLKGGSVKVRALRTEMDLPLWVVLVGALALVAAIASTGLIPTEIPGRIAGAALIVVLGFLFVTVSSRLTGEIGSSSNPISGMTVATLLFTCLVFVSLGWTAPDYRLAALSIAGIVCVAASNGGTTSQDLKTGYLVGATPRNQQLAILVGALTSAIFIGGTLLALNAAGTVYSKKPENLPTTAAPLDQLKEDATFEGKTYKVWRPTRDIRDASGKVTAAAGKYYVDPATGRAAVVVDPAINGRFNVLDDGKTRVDKYVAPKASLMALIIDGIMANDLPWGKVLLGVFIAIVLQLAGVPALAFAVGVYLPISASMPIFIGGLIRRLVEGIKRSDGSDSDSSPAVLLSSGYIAGGSIGSTILAFLAIPGLASKLDLSGRLPAAYNASMTPALVAFGGLVVLLFLVGNGTILRDVEPQAVAESVTGREEDL